MPPTGNSTPVESSPTAEPESITPSSPSDIPPILGSSKTPGVLLGEKKDSSD